MTNFDLIEMAKEAYISVMGYEKWQSLTNQQKHDAIMCIIVDFGKAYGAFADNGRLKGE